MVKHRDLLLAAIRPQPDIATIENLLAGEIDWPALQADAAYHRVTNLLHRGLSALADPEQLAPLRAQREQNRRIALYLTSQLLTVGDALERAGVIVIPLKGPTLSEAIYGDLSLRESSDLDLLVHPATVPAARAALAQMGFLLRTGLHSAPDRLLMRWKSELQFTRSAPGNPFETHIDLHWNIVPAYYPFRLCADDLASRAVAEVRCGHAWLLAAPEDTLLFLCIHGAKHYWEQLRWVADIAWFVHGNSELNIAGLRVRAREAGAARALDTGLQLARDLLGSALPFAPNFKARKLAGHAAARIATNSPTQPDTLVLCRYLLNMTPSWPRKVRLLLGLIFQPEEAEFVRYRLPHRIARLYYVLRIWNLANRYL